MRRRIEGRQRPWIFSVGSLFYFQRVCSLIFSLLVHIWCETAFLGPPQNGSRHFRLSLYLRDWCSTCVFTSSRLAANSLTNPSRPLTSSRLRREKHIYFHWFHTAQEIWNLWFFSFFLHHRRLYVWFFLLFFFFLALWVECSPMVRGT